jgi:hypothetical protein
MHAIAELTPLQVPSISHEKQHMSAHSCVTPCSGQLSAMHDRVGVQLGPARQAVYSVAHAPCDAHVQHVAQSVGATHDGSAPLEDSSPVPGTPLLSPLEPDAPELPLPLEVDPSPALVAVSSVAGAVSLAGSVVAQLLPAGQVTPNVSSLESSLEHAHDSRANAAKQRSIRAS